ncbi:MAG: manganese efflux pump MntP family protein [Dehalococcoidales bacterium]|nr:manganese efflux pump MntP family protein [Dehalococcoidales bacterium]
MSETGFFSIFIIALGLSADCFAVSLASSISLKTVPVRIGARIALAFGIFQAGMIVLGWLAGNTVIDFISSYDHWLAFGLLALIGGRMIWESLHEDEEKERKFSNIARWPVLLTLSVATSIDALAVGLSFAFLQVNLAMASSTIGVTACCITVLGLFIGKKVGSLVGKRAETVGGIVLILIGLRILVEHLL